MTETSWFWNGHVTGDAAVNAPYEMEQWANIHRLMFLVDTVYQGVIGGTLDSLAVTQSSTSSVTVGRGAAIVNGRIYYNDAPISFGVNGANSYWLIGLVMDMDGQTIRAFSRGGYNDAASAIASLYHYAPWPPTPPPINNKWEIPLAVVAIDAGGTVSTIYDKRLFVLRPEKHREFVPAVGCLNYTDTTDIIKRYEQGFALPDSHYAISYGNLIVPANFWKLLSISAVVIPAGSGDLYSRTYIEYGPFNNADEYYNDHIVSAGFGVSSVTVDKANLVNATSALNDLRQGLDDINDFLCFTFVRDATSAYDTIGGVVYFSGWVVEYAVLY